MTTLMFYSIFFLIELIQNSLKMILFKKEFDKVVMKKSRPIQLLKFELADIFFQFELLGSKIFSNNGSEKRCW